MKRLLRIVILLSLVVLGIYKYFFHIDLSNDCFVRINPSWFEFSNSSVKQAISILKHASAQDYDLFCANVSVIDPNLSCGGFDGGCFYDDRPDTIDISTSQRSLAWTASIIVHETCHVIQNKEKRIMSEDECDAMMVETLARIVEY